MRRTTRLISSLTVSAAKSVGHGSRKLHYSSRLLQNGSDESIVTTFTANTINKPVTSPATGGDSTIFDTEKEMFQIRRKMTAAYSLGKYQLALEHALDLEAKAAQIMGKRNAVYASCLNNVALMVRIRVSIRTHRLCSHCYPLWCVHS